MPTIQFTHPIQVGHDPLHAPQTHKPTPPPSIEIATLNIRDGRGIDGEAGLIAAVRALQKANIDLAILTETKISNEIYTKQCLGYDIACSTADGNSGGVALISKTNPRGWHLESTQFHGPNVLSTIYVTGKKRIPIIGAYLPPTTLDHLTDLDMALDRFPDADPMILGDLNVNIHNPATPRSHHVAAFIAAHGLFDLLPHFLQTSKYKDHTTWHQMRQGTLIRSRCDYILGTDRRLIQRLRIRDTRHYDSDHYMLRARLLRSPTNCHFKYLKGRRAFPLNHGTGAKSEIDTRFDELKAMGEHPRGPQKPDRPQWISEATLKLMDARSQLRKDPHHCRNRARTLTRQVRQGLKQDRQRRAERAATAIGECLSGGPGDHDIQGAYNIIKAWYKHATKRQPHPSREDLQRVSTEFANLYHKEDPSPPGPPIPTHVPPFPILDSIPTADEIGTAVKRLRNHRAPGPSGLRAEDFKEWYKEAHPDEFHPDTSTTVPPPPRLDRWNALVDMTQHIWSTGEIPTELKWTVLVLIPKGNDNTAKRGIGLLDLLWKLQESIMNIRITAAVQFHDVLHGFRARRGTGTALIEAKLCQELACMEQDPLYVIFLDLSKAYDTLDRPRALDIFQRYGMGPNMLRLVRNFWDGQQVVARQSGFHGHVFEATRGTTQGSIVSPTLFNIVLDCVTRHWLFLTVGNNQIVQTGLGQEARNKLSMFYADDGYISARDEAWLQEAATILTGLFRRVGLAANPVKTEAMICFPNSLPMHMSSAAYARRLTGMGPNYRERQRQRVICPECNKDFSSSSLAHHRRSQHGIEPEIDWTAPWFQDAPGQLYTISFPPHSNPQPCPIPGCPHQVITSGSEMRRHFVSRHWNDRVHVLEEHPAPYPSCERCGLQLPPHRLCNTHYNSVACRKGAERRRRREASLRCRAANEIVFSMHGQHLSRTRTFRYLGRPVTDTNGDWPAVFHNLKKARQQWALISRVLVKEGASTRAKGMFYKAIVQSVLLYGVESWTVTPAILKALESFHHRVARRITGLTPRLVAGEWHYPPLAEAMKLAGLYPMKEYVRRRQATYADYLATRPLYQLCVNTPPVPGTSRQLRYWEQDHELTEAEMEAMQAIEGDAAGGLDVQMDDVE